MLRKIILGCFFIFSLSSTSGQVFRSETFVLDYNSKQFIRILDGLKLDSVDSVGRSQGIGQVFRSSDNVFLNEIGLAYEGKPYMIMNSVSEHYNEVVKPGLVDSVFQKFHVPFVFRGRLVDYAFVAKNKRLIKQSKYVRDKYFRGKETPFGYIEFVW